MPVISLKCLECQTEFKSLKRTQKFCCRACYAKEDSRRKKEKYKHEPHHNKGYQHTLAWKEEASKRTVEQWKDERIRNSRVDRAKKTAMENGYANGYSPESIKKRNDTIERNGGHNLKGTYGTRKCDTTFNDRYGITSAEYRSQCLRNTDKTKPEIHFENILKELDIEYVYEYKFKNRYFDFGIESLKILVEIDGTYWHGKDTPYEKMNEQQRKTFMNDRYKDNLVKQSDWTLIRIWSDDLTNLSNKDIKQLLWERK